MSRPDTLGGEDATRVIETWPPVEMTQTKAAISREGSADAGPGKDKPRACDETGTGNSFTANSSSNSNGTCDTDSISKHNESCLNGNVSENVKLDENRDCTSQQNQNSQRQVPCGVRSSSRRDSGEYSEIDVDDDSTVGDSSCVDDAASGTHEASAGRRDDVMDFPDCLTPHATLAGEADPPDPQMTSRVTPQMTPNETPEVTPRPVDEDGGSSPLRRQNGFRETGGRGSRSPSKGEEDGEGEGGSNNSESTEGEEEEEEVDPRIAENLEIMNQSCADVNRLENELNEARTQYRLTFAACSHRMEELAKDIKKSIQRARAYFDMQEKAKEAQSEAVRAARQFQAASGQYRAAKEMITLAEESFYDRQQDSTRPLTSALQETLNHATEKVMESEREKTRSEAEHNKRAAIFAQLETQMQFQEKKFKRSISKARPYFETKAELELKLQQLKQHLQDLGCAISTRKARYADALKRLEAVSTEIHESRQQKARQEMLLKYPREPGVGAESDSLCSSISDTNIERGIFSTTSYDYDDDEDDDYLSDDSSELSSSAGSRGHSRQGSRDRPPVTKTSSLRVEERRRLRHQRHQRSVSNGSAPDSVFASPASSLPQSPMSAGSPAFPTASHGQATGNAESPLASSLGSPAFPRVSTPNGSPLVHDSAHTSPRRHANSGKQEAHSSTGYIINSDDGLNHHNGMNDCDIEAGRSRSVSSPYPISNCYTLHEIKESSPRPYAPDEEEASGYAKEGGGEDVKNSSEVKDEEPLTKESESVPTQERAEGDGSVSEDTTRNASSAGAAVSRSVSADTSRALPGPSPSLPTVSRNGLGVTKSLPPTTADNGNSNRPFLAKAKEFFNKVKAGPNNSNTHTRLDNRHSSERDVNANPGAGSAPSSAVLSSSAPSRPAFHLSQHTGPAYLGPGIQAPPSLAAVSTNERPAGGDVHVSGCKGQVPKAPLSRTDSRGNKPLQGIFLLNPSQLHSSSTSYRF